MSTRPHRLAEAIEVIARYYDAQKYGREGVEGYRKSTDLVKFAQVARELKRVGVLSETATTEALFASPAHPYTAALLAAVPRLQGPVDARPAGIPGTPPRPGELYVGCAFAPRCGRADAHCAAQRPALRPHPPGSSDVACHRPLQAALETA